MIIRISILCVSLTTRGFHTPVGRKGPADDGKRPRPLFCGSMVGIMHVLLVVSNRFRCTSDICFHLLLLLFWFVSWLVGWLVVWLLASLLGWLVVWLLASLLGWLVGWLIGWCRCCRGGRWCVDFRDHFERWCWN